MSACGEYGEDMYGNPDGYEQQRVGSSILTGRLMSNRDTTVLLTSGRVKEPEEVDVRASSLVIPGFRVSARALSRGMRLTGTFTLIPCREFDRLGGLDGVHFPRPRLSLLCWNESSANLLQAEKTSFAASPEKPRAASHSLKMGSHFMLAGTVQLPILLSNLAILNVSEWK